MKSLFSLRGFWPYLIVLFFNSFVDLGHKILVQNTVFKAFDGQTQIILTAIVNGLILLPFVFLFTPAGFLADKYPKPKVMQVSAAAAVVLACAITFFYYQGWFWLAFAMTLGLAIQSAVYSPSKYGFIRELVGDENLARANGIVQAATIVSILFSTFAFSGAFEWRYFEGNKDVSQIIQDMAPLGWALIVLTLIELVMAFRLPMLREKDESKTFSASEYLNGSYLRKNLTALTENRVIWLSIVGLSLFWAVSQVVLAAFPAYAKANLGETNTLVIQAILACAGIGIMLGSVTAGRLSANHIELGLIPVGAIGIAVMLALITTLESRVGLGLAYIGLGFLGSWFIVPLNALIQYHAHDDKLGTVLAGNNWVQTIVMLAFLSLTVVFAWFGLNSFGLFLLCALVAAGGAVYTISQLPHSLVRMLLSTLFRRAYRIEIVGFENLPKEGGCLLLGNHISWIDWALVQIACPRAVRFVMYRGIYERWYLKPFFKLFGVIPIAAGQSRASLEAINERLKQGEVVCLFPEGAISKTGQLGKFHSGFERTVEGVDGVIVPFFLRGLWGSRLSKSYSSKLRRNTNPGLKRDLVVAFGEPLPMTTKADELKQKVFELSYHAWEEFTNDLNPLPLAWLKSAKRDLRSIAVKESQGESLSNFGLMAATLSMAPLLVNKKEKANVGIMLPSTRASLIANLAVLLKGRTVVNVNYTSSVDAVTSGLDQAEVETVITSKRFLSKLRQKGMDVDAMLAGRKLIEMESLKPKLPSWKLFLNGLIAAALPASWLVHLYGEKTRLEETAAILFSSGSEGQPKGVMLSHRNIMANIKQVSEVLNTQSNDVVMGSLPPFHSFGLTVTTLMPAIEGLPVVCHPDPTDVVNIAKAIAKYDVTILCATATFLRLYAKNRKVESLMLDPLRVVVAGAEKLTPQVHDAFKLKFNKPIYEGFGTTETTPVVSVNVPDKLDVSNWKVQQGTKHGSVGMPLPGSAFRVVDPETLEPLPVGESGLILISGPQLMQGYLKQPEKTAEVLVELNGRRWYKTGDKGYQDEYGFLTIVDRYSRFAKLGGEMVSLTAVEQLVREHCEDSEVELVAVGVADEKKGEKVVLLHTAKLEPEAIKAKALQAGANPLMLPSEWRVIKELPKLGSGKVDFKGAKALIEKAESC